METVAPTGARAVSRQQRNMRRIIGAGSCSGAGSASLVIQLIRIAPNVVISDKVLVVAELTKEAVLGAGHAPEAGVAIVGGILALASEFRQAQLQ